VIANVTEDIHSVIGMNARNDAAGRELRTNVDQVLAVIAARVLLERGRRIETHSCEEVDEVKTIATFGRIRIAIEALLGGLW
jgi:hypothetical protein